MLERNMSAVAVEPLAERLGTSKGSFYWHFSDRADLVAATLALWEQRETTDVIEQIRSLPDPRAQLVALGRAAYASAARGNGHAAVLAAAADTTVAAVLARVTRTRLAFLTDLYRRLGASRKESAHLGRLAYAIYLGIAALRQADPARDLKGRQLEAFLERAIEVLLAPVTGPERGAVRTR
jgi:AcrR family transcriptional regulator